MGVQLIALRRGVISDQLALGVPESEQLAVGVAQRDPPAACALLVLSAREGTGRSGCELLQRLGSEPRLEVHAAQAGGVLGGR